MRQWIKRMSIVIISLVFLLVIGGILLVTFVSPNHFKPLIEQQVYKTTGRTLTLGGDIHWAFFPSLGLKIEKASLGNREGFGALPFASVDVAKVSVRVLPLLSGRVEMGEWFVDGLTLNLVKNRAGKTNWQDVMVLQPKEAEIQQEKGEKRFKLHFSKLDLRFKNITVNWRDLSTGEEVKTTLLHFMAKDVQSHTPFPIKLALNVDSDQPRMQSQLALVGKLKMDPEKKWYRLDDLRLHVKLRGPTLPNGKLDASLDSSFVLTPRRFKAESFQLKLNESNIKGSFDISDLKSQKGRFDVTVDTFDLDPWMTQDGTQEKSGMLPHTGGGKKASDVTLSRFLRRLNLSGKLKIGRLKVANMRADQVKVSMHSSGGIITLSPMTAVFYRGKIGSTVNINAERAIPRIQMDGKVKGVALSSLLKDLAGYRKIEGVSDLTFRLYLKGTDIRTLNGHMTFKVQNGLFKGIHIAHLVDVGRALVKKQVPPPREGPNQTDFGTLTGTAVIERGVMKNDDLHMISNTLEAKGRGTIDFVSARMDYDLDANLVSNPNFIVPIEIKGPFDHLKKGVDEKRLLFRAAKHELEKHKEQIQKKIKKKVKSLGLDKLLFGGDASN